MFQGVTILAGPARCGKTERLLTAYREVVAAGPPGVALWLSPTHRSVVAVRRQLISGTLSGCLAPQCLTFEHFAVQVLDASRELVRPLPPPLARDLLRRLVEEAAHKGKLDYFAPIVGTRGFLDLVVGYIRELKRLEVWPEELAAACGSQKDRELCHLYESYQAVLARHRLYDWQGRFWSARAQLRNGQLKPITRLRHVMVDGFTDFTRTEHEVLQILAARVESLTITLPCDDESRREELFAKTAKTVAELSRRHPRLKIERLAPRSIRWPAMNHLERHLFANPRQVPPAPAAAGIEIVPAAGATQEIELVARRVKQLLVGGESPAAEPPVAASDILVVFRTVGETGEQVREVFAQFGIPVAVAGQASLERAPVVSALLAWLRLDLEDWPFRQVLRVIAHNLFRPTWPEWQAGRAVESLERLVHHLQIPSGRAALASGISRWARRHEECAPGEVPDRRATLAADAVLALPLVERMGRILDALPARATFAEWAESLTSLASSTGMLHDVDDHIAWQKLVAALLARDRLSRLLDDDPEQLARRDFNARLRELVRDEPLPQLEDETGRVRVLPAEQARGLSAPYVFMAGLSEKSFPQPYRDDCIYSESETRELVAAGLPLIPHADRRGYEMLLFYEVATRATRKLVLSYPALDPAGLPLSPSPYLIELEHAFAPSGVPRSGPPELGAVPSTDEVHSPRDFRVRAVAQALAGESEMLAELSQHGSTSTTAGNILAGLRVTEWRREGQSFGPFEGMMTSAAVRPLLAARYGSDRCWTPSQLEQYAGCPYQFFLASVLRIEPLEEPRLEVDFRGRGQMLHSVLSELHRRLNQERGRPASPAEGSPAELVAASLTLLRQRVERLLGDHPLADGLLEIDARRVASWLNGYHRQHADYDANWQQWSSPPRPAHFEVAFGPLGSSARKSSESESETTDPLSTPEPFELECGGETIRFAGRIDRIDLGQLDGQAVFSIVDYKSGRVSVRTSLNAVAEGYALQLPIYALAARRLLSELGALPLRAAYWHVAGHGYKEKDAIKFHLEADGQLMINPDWEAMETALRARIGRLVHGIRQGEFPMHSADEHCTSYCAYRTVCRVNQVRQLGKAWQPSGEESS